MFKFLDRLFLLLCICCVQAQVQVQAQTYPTIGRAATVAEIAAWDSDVRPDFRGLPVGSGSVSQGMKVWEKNAHRVMVTLQNHPLFFHH